MSLQYNKRLPPAPPCFEDLHKENAELKERNLFLEDVLEILYVQNQQLSSCLNARKKQYRAHKAKVDRLLKSITDLSTTQAQHHEALQRQDKERQEHWEEFCQHKTRVNSNHLWEYLEKIKSDIIEKQYEDLLRANEDMEIVIGIDIQEGN
ncbi:hypothetical protein L207DRAFT_527247 [Hyaloscypha variabilis F]|uniref:Uncharacterized protein n=1 Tax=Hyaloscypha variabilis (strain UAMH 11265 / GT02V1 / F) TaxID=1149755 RepID=A0A2J6RUY3_HYAVF|nr:hypothetical protein L207DRAFT_527247 [Hyaloscypha variabilis F]